MHGGGWIHRDPFLWQGQIRPLGAIAVNLTPKPGFRPWGNPWTPKPPSCSADARFRQLVALRAADQARYQAEQARARERAAREARERAEREFRRAEQERLLRESLKRGLIAQQQQQQRLRDELAHQASRRMEQLQNRKALQQVDAMLEYHRSVGRKWMAERGLFGLSGGLRPVAKVLARGVGKVLEVAGLVAPPAAAGGAMVLGGLYQRAGDEINQYEEFLQSHTRPEGQQRVTVTPHAAEVDPRLKLVGQYAVAVAATVKLSVQDRLAKDIACAFADRLLEQQSSRPGVSVNQISADAHKLVQDVDLPEICRKYGIKPGQVEVEPISGVTGARGGQIRYDAGVFGRRRAALFELKSSAYETERTALQLQAHQIGVGEQTATYGKPGDYYRIYAKERRIEKWTGEDLARQFRAQRQPPLNAKGTNLWRAKFRAR